MKHSSLIKIVSKPKDQGKASPSPVPDLEVEFTPKIEVTVPAPDMSVVAEAIKQISLPTPDVHVHNNEQRKPRKVNIEVERDGRGFIKNLICTELIE